MVLQRFTKYIHTKSPSILCKPICKSTYIPSRGFAKKRTNAKDMFVSGDAAESSQQQTKQVTKKRSADADSKAKDTRTKALMESNEERLRKFYPMIQPGIDRRTEEEQLRDWTIERRYVLNSNLINLCYIYSLFFSFAYW
jgi:hypothetical protein